MSSSCRIMTAECSMSCPKKNAGLRELRELGQSACARTLTLCRGDALAKLPVIRPSSVTDVLMNQAVQIGIPLNSNRFFN